MSGIINVSAYNSPEMFSNDEILQPVYYRTEVLFGVLLAAPAFWPGPRLPGCDLNFLSGVLTAPSYELVTAHFGGTKARKLISGITRDGNGNVIAGVTVKAFQTSNGEYVGQATSLSDGSYTISTPYATNHFVVAYLTGSPDTAGTTVNTVAGV